MRKNVFLLLFALCFPVVMMAQSNDDDLYYIPKKDKNVTEGNKKEATVLKQDRKKEGTTIYTSPGTTVVVRDYKGKVRNVDEYNRRYESRDNDFVMEDDTLYIDEKSPGALRGEWVNGFEGSQDDYEYAERIIRFRNPRYAISISSPYYWDVVYGLNSWDWNVYTDNYYAYAFPTFSNRLWWDWRWGSAGFGWGPSWGYYGWNSCYPGYYSGWYGGWGTGGGYYPHHWDSWYPSYGGSYWAGPTYTNRRSTGHRVTSGSTSRPGYAQSSSTSRRSNETNSIRSNNFSGRVVGTRQSSERQGGSVRSEASTSRNSAYTRPSSTNRGTSSVSNGGESNRSSSMRSSADVSSRNSSYERGSSSTSSPSYSRGSTSYSRGSSSSSSSRSSSSSSGNSSRSSSYSSGSSSRSSGYSSGSSSRSSSYSSGSSSGSSSRSSGGSSGSGGSSSRSSGGRR